MAVASVGKMRAEGGTLPPFPQLPELAVSVTARVEGRLTGIERAEQVRDMANWKRDIDEKSLGWSTDRLGSNLSS